MAVSSFSWLGHSLLCAWTTASSSSRLSEAPCIRNDTHTAAFAAASSTEVQMQKQKPPSRSLESGMTRPLPAPACSLTTVTWARRRPPVQAKLRPLELCGREGLGVASAHLGTLLWWLNTVPRGHASATCSPLRVTSARPCLIVTWTKPSKKRQHVERGAAFSCGLEAWASEGVRAPA